MTCLKRSKTTFLTQQKTSGSVSRSVVSDSCDPTGCSLPGFSVTVWVIRDARHSRTYEQWATNWGGSFANLSLPIEVQVWSGEEKWVRPWESNNHFLGKVGKAEVWDMECSTDGSIFDYMQSKSVLTKKCKGKKNATGNFVHMFKRELQNWFLFL